LHDNCNYIHLISEGIAECLDAVYSSGRENLLSEYKEMSNMNEVPRISDIYLNESFDKSGFGGDIDYTTSGAFITYLVETYGFERFLEFEANTKADSLIPKTIKEVYSKDFKTIENDFNKWIENLKLPGISSEFNEKAEEIFNMDDPENDDNGNGNYVYPADPKCKPGIFDLTKFRVLRDKKNIYFELKFKNLVDHDSVDYGFYRNYISLIIKTDTPKSENSSFRFLNVNLEAYPNYVFYITQKGIQLRSRNILLHEIIKLHCSNYSKFGDTTNKCIRFAVSRELVGEIDGKSGYIVGIGAGDISKGFKKKYDYIHNDIAKVDSIANKNNGGGGSVTNYNPNFYDILLPKEINQQKLLNSYSIENKKQVVLPYVYKK
jgi:hypothetical protein